jgi:ubiquinone/menaquinone biosynthesis C-methylase UbiE/uncharacterized protein YbaR (Trm112 family)
VTEVLRVSDRLLAALACPVCRWQLTRDGAGLVCPHCGAAFPAGDGIIDFLGETPSRRTLARRAGGPRAAAAAYDAWRVVAFSLLSGRYFPQEREHEVVRRWLGPLRPGIYLDLGCGTGRQGIAVAEALASQGVAAEVLLVDSSEGMLRRASRLARSRENAVLIRADVENLPLQDGAVVGAMDAGGFNRYHHPRWALSEVARALQEASSFVLANQVKSGPPLSLMQIAGRRAGRAFPSETETLAWLGEAGLSVRRHWRRGALMVSRSVKHASQTP